MNVTEVMALSLDYAYGFRNSITAPVREATGVGVSMAGQLQMLTFTLQFKFGGGWAKWLAGPGGCDMPATTATVPVEPARPAALPGPQVGG